MGDVNNSDLAMMLGRLEGKLDMVLANQERLNGRVDDVETRLRHVEVQAAKSGAIGGGIAAVGTAIAIKMLERVFM
ncbi:hypothetical protein [Chitinibacter sp. ZOR0017]|uniref:hypothetical protein n=1 Tax=Chitinibacter sp. ZOR0017 TaxID=1339254 RepID=UPI000647D8D4|nr:hypothetical protein [Chitinibacter sp. ZOR0017]